MIDRELLAAVRRNRPHAAVEQMFDLPKPDWANARKPVPSNNGPSGHREPAADAGMASGISLPRP